MKNEKGFSLAETMIAAGLIGGLALVLMKLTNTSTKTMKQVETSGEITAILAEMRAIISNPENCLKTFNGKNAVNDPNVNDKLVYTNNVGADIDKFKTISNDPSVKYGNGTLQIQNYALSDAGGDVNVSAEQTTHLNVTFDRGKLLTPRQLIKKIKLFVEVDGGNNITGCRALSATENNIWSRNNTDQNNIYYDGGKVGVANSNPTTELDVTGTISATNLNTTGDISAVNVNAAGDIAAVNGNFSGSVSGNSLIANQASLSMGIKIGNDAAACSVANEGSIRYNSGTKKMEFCNGAVWGAMGGPSIRCNWAGERYLSHGWDAAPAWMNGAYINCTNNVVVDIKFVVGTSLWCPGGFNCPAIPPAP